MATNNSIGLNIELPIYNSNGSSFHGLVLHKCTYDSVVMSLGDKITGDVYYNGNTLAVTMQEYVELDGVKFVLVTPPTVVREGMVSENSQLNGMTKYSFVFYHPMYMLGNFPFTDVAVTSSEAKYLSESKKFTWIGYPDDFIAKVNKNLDGTEWIVEKSSRFPAYLDDQLSDVLSFDGNTIADACKTFYDTWGAPYIVAKVESTETAYANGKRFKVIFGLPSNEIYEDATHQQSGTPYIFRFGKGVGLKNNSRTPRGNKIVTRIAGSGSENNIPYGYPQIPWYGDSRWDYTEYEGDTINYDSDGHVTNTPKTTAYPLYMGIVGGAYVKLIKHPFTRTNLMPSIYGQTLFNKVSPYLSDGADNPDYNPNTTLIDYYDAIATQEYPYPNPIVANAPSYESHQFEDIKPELGQNVAIVDAYPVNKDMTPAQAWDDSMDDDGNYVQSYFKMQLPVLSFDLYACAAITQEMQINMRSGACLGCTFTIQVDWDDYKRNFYDNDGNFAPAGSQRDYTKYPDSSQEQITVVLQKETATFGTLMPNMYQYPVADDAFVVLGISLPLSYIESAEERLDGEMKSYMLENNVHYFDYPLKFDEAFLRNNPYILSQIKPNSIVRFQYGNDTMQLFVKQMSVKYGEGVLPKYDITLTDNVEVVLNRIGQVAEDVEKLASLIAILRQNYNRSVWNELAKKLSKTQDDTAAGYITMLKGLQIGANFVPDILGEGGVLRMRQDGKVELVTDILYARMKAYFDSVEIREYQHTGGNRIASVAGNRVCRVEYIKVVDNVETIVDDASEADFFRCYFRASDGEDTVKNNWVVGDLAYCHVTSIVNSSDNPEQKGLNQKHLWRLVIGRNTDGTLTEDGEAYIDLSNRATETISGTSYTGYQSGSDIPTAQDDIIQLGNVNDTTRQGAIVEFVTGTDAPSYQIYQGINSFSLNNKNQIGFGYNTSTGRAYLNVYGDFRFGARPNTQGSYLEYNSQTGALNIKAHVEFTNTDSELDTLVQAHQKTYDNAIAALIRETEDLQAQIDGAIESYFMEGEPSLTTPPVMNTEETHYEEAWLTGEETEEERIAILNKHIGDLYYDKETGHGYRFLYDDDTSDYVWAILTDEDVTEALRLASEAQETADGKSTTFLNNTSDQDESKRYPTNYKKGDTWILQVDATIGTTAYKAGDILTASTDSETYSAAHWSKQVRYTDDTKADSILNNSYYQQLTGGTISQNITNAANAASAAQSAANNAQSTANAAQTSAAAANNKLNTWADDGVISPTEKLALKNQKADVEKEYAQIIVDAAKYTGVSTTAFTTAYNRAITAFNYYTDDSTEDITIITDEDEDTDATPRYSRISAYYAARQTVLNDFATAAKKYATDKAAEAAEAFKSDAVYRALKSALGSKTDIVGGLVLTSLIGMRQNTGTEQSPIYKTWGGISGEYDALAKGGGIAAWYGGDMLDREDTDDSSSSSSEEEEEPRYATSLFRFDGSGYLASGNITWDEQGRVSIKDVTSIISNNNTDVLNELITFNNAFHFNLSQGTSTVLSIEPQAAFTNLYIRNTTNPNAPYHVATENWVDDHYVSKTFFRQLFRAFKPNETAGQADVEVQPNTIDATISNIKAMVGFWTEQYVSALGNNSDGGGGGAGVLYGLNDVTPNATGDGVLGAQDGYVLTYNGSTHHWYAAATAETYVLPQATSGALGGIKIGYSGTGKNYAIALDTNGKAYVNVPWTDTTYTLAGLMGSTAIGGATQPIYWDGTAFVNTTYTLAKSVPADAKFTDTTYSFSNADATLAWSTRTKIATTGGTDIYVTMPANPNTWRNIYLGGTSKVGTATNTKALNFVAGSNIDITYTAAGTGEDESGSADYFNIEIKAKNVYDSSTSRTKNTVLAAPNGSNGAATFRTLVAADIPNLAASKITSGTFDTARIPTLAISKISGLQDALDSKLDKSFFNSLFRAHKTVSGVDTVISANGDLTDAESIEAMFGFWTEQYISSLGQGSDGGGGGQGDVTWDLLASSSDTRQIALSHLTTALAGYSTTSHTHTTTIAADSGTNQLTLAYGTKYKITAGGTSFIFTMPSADDTNTWRNIYVAGTQQITTAVNTKGLNFAAGNNVSLSFAAAGTGSGQSGNANYGTLTISATDTTYSNATQSAAGLMSAADKKKLDGVATNANNYSLPLAASGTRGGVQIGYTENGKNYAVQLSSEKMYVNVPWTDTTYTVATGDSNGQIKVTPSSGSAYNVSVKGLGSAAYLTADTSATNSTVAQRTANGYLFATYFNQSSGTETPTTNSYWFFANSDGYLRKSTRADLESTIYPYEAKLQWGGGNFSGTYGCIDAAMVPELGANRAAFTAASAITIQYSTNGGSSWSDYGASDAEKLKLLSGVGATFALGKNTSTGVNYTNYRLRVIINTDGQIYSVLNKFVIYISSNGSSGTWCTIDARLQSNKESNTDTWVTFANQVGISGWSGYNVINTSGITTYGNTKTSQYGQLRFTFGNTGYSSSYSGMRLYKIFCFGGVGWTTPSTMAKTGHLYSYDEKQRAYFPEYVSGSGFIKSNSSDSYVLLGGGGHATISSLSVGSAAKLTTSRTLWGQSFDGSANISGDMSDVGKINGAVSITSGNSTNPLLNITRVSATTDFISMYVTATHRPLVLQLDAGNVGVGVAQPSYKLHVSGTFGVTGATTLSSTLAVTGATTLTGLLTANGNIATGTGDGTYIQIGGARIVWDNTNKALKVIQSDNSTAANFYATGAISALGQGVDGGGGGGQGDVTWDLLASQATGGRTIHSSYISGTLANYLPLYNTGEKVIEFDVSDVNQMLTIKRTSANYSMIKYQRSTTVCGYLGFSSSDVPTYRTAGGTDYTLSHSGNSSVSKSGETLTVKINGTEKSLTNTNTWRGIQNNLTSDSTTDSLSAAQGKALANGSARDDTKLPLSGGTSYPMTGTLYVGTSLGITDASGNGLLCYHPGTWTGVTSSQWGVGTTDSQGVIRSSATNLVHYKGDTAYDILDSSNSSVSLSGSTLTVKINGTSKSLTNTNTTYSAGSGLSLNSTTFSVKTPSSGAWFGATAYVNSDGVMEVGRYIDFHPTSASTLDYNIRLDAGTGTTARTFTFADTAGTLLSSGNSSVSKSGETLTVKINGTSQSLTNTDHYAWSDITGKPSTYAPSAHTHSYIEAKGNYTFDSSTLPNSFDYGVSAGFVNSNSGFGSYGSVLTVRTYSGGGGSLQLYAPYSSTLGGTHLKARFGNYASSSGNSWTDLKEVAWVSDIPTNNNQLTNGAGYITSSGSCSYATSAGKATNDSDGNAINTTYLKLSGDTMTGAIVREGNALNTTGGFNQVYISNAFLVLGDGNPSRDKDTYLDGSNILFRTGSSTINKREIMRITSGGNVGIGTTAPAYKLDVVGISRSDYHVFFNTARNGEAGYIGRGSSSSNDLYFCGYSGVALRFLTNSSERMTITSDGSVGIGTNSPSYKLHVNGNGYYSGSLTINGNTVPNSDNAYNLGSTSNYWQNVYHYNSCVWNHVNIGYQKGQYTANRAELTVISRTDVPADIYFGCSNAYKWQISSRASGDSYKLNFYYSPSAGSSHMSLTLDQSGNLISQGGVSALSDARHKQVIRDTNLSVEQIAKMPSVIFKWTDGKHDNDLHVGTLAQSWQQVLPEVVLEGQDKEHTLSLSYGVAALVAAITTARKVVDHEKRITELEKENRELREEINRLKIA